MNALQSLVDTPAESIHVIHVDDEPDFADLTATYLERENDRFEVTTATSVDEALNVLAEADVDCIVSDYDMPGLNGIELLEAVRVDYPDLPFILFTGKGSEEVASEAISAGVTDYLQKEHGVDQYTVLANRVSNAIEHSRSQQLVERSEQRLREIIDGLPHPLYVVSADGQYLLASEALASFHETTVDALEGTDMREVVNESAASRLQQAFDEVIETGTRTRLREVVVTDADGEDHLFEPQLLPFDLGDGERAVLGIAIDVTERRQREYEIQRTRERMRLALDHTRSIVFDLDLDTGEVVRHGSFEEYFRLDPEDITTWEAYLDSTVHPEDREPFRKFYEQLIDGERGGGTFEYRTHPDRGSVRWVRDTVSVETDSADDSRQAVGITRDVTERKGRELDLRGKERRYQAVFNDPNTLVGFVDTDGTVLEINQMAMEYVDADPADVVGDPLWTTPWFDRSAETRQEARQWIDRAVSGDYVEFEADLDQPNGESHTFEGVFRPVTDQEGAVVSVFMSGRDITERKNRERELQRYEAYLEESSDIVTVIAEDGTITYQSPAVERVLGYGPDAFIGQNGFDFIHPDDVTAVREKFAELLVEPGSTVTAECRFRTADDEWRWLELRGTNRLDHDPINGIVTNNRDITERKEREKALKRERDRLDEFASVVSHDLRTPLNVAEGRLELAQEEHRSDNLDTVETALDRMNSIIEDVLTLSREGRDIGSMDSVAVQEVVTTVWDIVADAESAADLRFPDNDLSTLTIEADTDRFRQLLENLLRNAIEHGGDDVTVTVGAMADGFYIEDDGPGIAKNSHDDVFAAGYSTNQEGTGFGLSIVKRVAEAHGWEISVIDGSRGGPRFEITGVEMTAE
ncbi:MAG: PAS domain S-box protein [Halobellus sp.]|uniref:PAS domain S-box protein n=1 Tax=Halobellus sp. TaxID=1979212 RepID=UPI0035D3ECBB